MIEIPFSERYHLNLETRNGNASGYEHCIICGRGIKYGTARYRAHIWQGNQLILAEELATKTEEERQRSYLNTYAVGTDCRKNHPELKDYIFNVKKEDLES